MAAMGNANYYPPAPEDYSGMYASLGFILKSFFFSNYDRPGPVNTVTSPPVLSARTQYANLKFKKAAFKNFLGKDSSLPGMVG